MALAADSLEGKPSRVPRLQELSRVELGKQVTYDGPTWLDQAILSKWQPEQGVPGFARDLGSALAGRGRWLAERKLATLSPASDIAPTPEMMRILRRSETERVVQDVSRVLSAAYVHTEPGVRITGIYDRFITTPTGKLAVIRRDDTFTLAPWRPALEPLRGQSVTGMVGPNRVTWTLDRGRTLPGRT